MVRIFVLVLHKIEYNTKFHFENQLISTYILTFSETFGLEISFDGSDEMNISQMLFDLLLRFGIMIQQADHGSNEMNEKISKFCFGLKLFPEITIGQAYEQ